MGLRAMLVRCDRRPRIHFPGVARRVTMRTSLQLKQCARCSAVVSRMRGESILRVPCRGNCNRARKRIAMENRIAAIEKFRDEIVFVTRRCATSGHDKLPCDDEKSSATRLREAKYAARHRSRRTASTRHCATYRRRARCGERAARPPPEGPFGGPFRRAGCSAASRISSIQPRDAALLSGLAEGPAGSAMSERRAFLLAFLEFFMSQLDAVLKRIDTDLDASLDRLFALLRIQSDLDRSGLQGFLPRRRRLCRRRSEQHRLCRRGAADARPSDRDRQIRQRQSRQGERQAARVLFYGHYDVQPVDPLDGVDPSAVRAAAGDPARRPKNNYCPRRLRR